MLSTPIANYGFHCCSQLCFAVSTSWLSVFRCFFDFLSLISPCNAARSGHIVMCSPLWLVAIFVVVSQCFRFVFVLLRPIVVIIRKDQCVFIAEHVPCVVISSRAVAASVVTCTWLRCFVIDRIADGKIYALRFVSFCLLLRRCYVCRS